MFATLIHSDWSVEPRKRWCASAARRDHRWFVQPPRKVGPLTNFVEELFETGKAGGILAGFDFPIGVPATYGRKTGLPAFPDLVSAVGEGRWRDFARVAVIASEISLERPFYPQVSRRGLRRFDLFKAHGVTAMEMLLRECERKTPERPAACSLFWTLGGNQVGKAALSGWQEVVKPALARGARLWPFEGNLQELASTSGVVIAETYPAEAYGHIGLVFARNESKRNQAHRASKAGVLRDWAARNGVQFAEDTAEAIRFGFGADAAGEDRFDALLGLIGMVEVAAGRRPEGGPGSDAARLWEGWILGQALPGQVAAGPL